MRLVPVVLATMVASASVNAADPNGRFHIVGAGAVTCQQYIDATPEQRLYAETWWAGYFTALNRTTADTYHVMGQVPTEQVNEMLRAYCADNPNDRFAIAVHKVLEQLYPNRIRRSPN
jgi:hypothetical protein